MNFILLAEKTLDIGKDRDIIGALLEKATDWALSTGIKIIISLIILLISFKLINKISKRIEKLGNLEKYDKTLMRTLAYIARVAAKILIVICIIGYLGINTSGISAVVASLGVCVGLAVNGALSNLAGGVLIIITRPFKIDDFIELQGISGTVEDIHIISTKIRTPDNKVVYIPNGSVISGNITNFSEKATRRVDLTFSIGYENDFEKAKAIVLKICNEHPKVLKEPEPFVRVSEHAASSVNIVSRCWVNTEDYWDVHFDILESVKKEFDKNSIEIPFEQLDVHVKNS